MTKEAAIENLKYAISDNCTENLSDFREEIEIAIKELEKSLVKKESKALNRCTCGSKQKPQLWYDTSNSLKFFKCNNCGKRSAGAKTETQARKNWNAFIELEES